MDGRRRNRMYHKLFASDLDGTLLNHDHHTDAVITEGIRRLHEAGCVVAPTTGRSPSMCSGLDLPCAPFIACNGALVTGPDGTILKKSIIRPDYIQQLCQQFEQLPFEFVTPRGILTRRSEKETRAAFMERWARRGKPRTSLDFESMFKNHVYDMTVDQLVQEEIIKINCNNTGDEDCRRLEQWVEAHEDIINAPSDSVLFELTMADATKASGVACLADALGLKDEDVYVFGDGTNDLTMLAAYENSWCPDNGAKEARLLARHHLRARDEHCVIHKMLEIAIPKQVFFSDLDGTLLDAFHEVAPATRQVMEDVRAAGGHVIACTGRSPLSAQPLGLGTDWLIGMNGAMVLDETGKTVRKCVIPENDVIDLLQAFGRWSMIFLTEDGIYSNRSKRAHLSSMKRHLKLNNIRKLPKRPSIYLQIGKFSVPAGQISRLEVLKVEIHPQNEEEEALLAAWLKKHPHLVSAPSMNGLAEITIRDADKGKAARFVAQSLGADDAQVAVFGDGRNDIPLLTEFWDSYSPDTGSPDAAAAARTILEMDDPLAVTSQIRRLFYGQ